MVYLADVFFGMRVPEPVDRSYDQTLQWTFGTSLLFSTVAIVFSWAWQRSDERGPREWVMRRIAGRPIRRRCTQLVPVR